MDKTLKENLSSGQVWVRGGFILIFAICYSIAKVIVAGIVVFQFVTLLVTGNINTRLGVFSNELSVYLYQLLQFMMSNVDEKPFPFSDWPMSAGIKAAPVTPEKQVARKKASRKKKTVASKSNDNTGEKMDSPEEKQ